MIYKVTRSIVAVIMRLCWRVSYEGKEHVPVTEPFVLAPVHRSWLDFALVTGITRRRLCFMAKDSIFKPKAFRPLLRSLGAFPVRRGGPDREAMRQVMAVIARGEPVVMFPEGTRRTGPVVKDLYEGPAYVATKTGIPIVPVGVGGSERALPRGKKVPRPVKVHVVVGPPIRPPATEPGARTPRRVLHEVTAELEAEVQRLFDLAQERVNKKGRSIV